MHVEPETEKNYDDDICALYYAIRVDIRNRARIETSKNWCHNLRRL